MSSASVVSVWEQINAKRASITFNFLLAPGGCTALVNMQIKTQSVMECKKFTTGNIWSSILLHLLGEKTSSEETTVFRSAHMLLSWFSLLSLSVHCFFLSAADRKEIEGFFCHFSMIPCSVSEQKVLCLQFSASLIKLGLWLPRRQRAVEVEGLTPAPYNESGYLGIFQQ